MYAHICKILLLVNNLVSDWFLRNLYLSIAFCLSSERFPLEDLLLDNIGDIIGLQESEGARFSSGNVQGVAWLAEQLDMYYYYGGSTQEQLYGNAILSVWPIIESTFEVYPRSETQWYYKVVKATLTFEVDDKGKCNTVELFQNGVRQKAKRIE